MSDRPNDPATDGLAVYLVGGAVRDALLGIAVVDRDYVVVGATPDDMLKRGFKPVGADFPVFIHPRSAEEYALARTERKSGRGYRGFAFHADPSVSIEDDLRRRDFTINAMAQAADGELVDPYGGAADLTARRLAHVSEAFAEDPVRVLRAARFMARFADLGFKIAPATLALMRAMVASGEVDALVPERVWQELRRALAMPKPAAFLRTMRATGALARVLPEVDALYGVPQPAQWHPEIDCGVHTELVLDMAAQLSPGNDRVGFAALVHDLGKALTPADILPGHRGHETAGLEPINALSERVGVPGEHRRLARIVCREHLNIHRLGEMRPTTVVALLERVGAFQRADVIDELASTCEADKRGRTGLADVPYPQAGWLKSLHAAAARVRVADLDLDPSLAGPAIGEALRRARIAAVAQARADLAIDI